MLMAGATYVAGDFISLKMCAAFVPVAQRRCGNLDNNDDRTLHCISDSAHIRYSSTATITTNVTMITKAVVKGKK